jgi:hypothetical protein
MQFAERRLQTSLGLADDVGAAYTGMLAAITGKTALVVVERGEKLPVFVS